MPPKRKIAWEFADWDMPTSQIAKMLGAKANTVAKKRAQLAPETRKQFFSKRENSPDVREKMAKIARENIKLASGKGTIAAQLSPRAGAYHTNALAKCYIITSPEGTRYHWRNLRDFVRNHRELFGEDGVDSKRKNGVTYTRAEAGLSNILAKKTTAWKGWQIREVNKSEIFTHGAIFETRTEEKR